MLQVSDGDLGITIRVCPIHMNCVLLEQLDSAISSTMWVHIPQNLIGITIQSIKDISKPWSTPNE